MTTRVLCADITHAIVAVVSPNDCVPEPITRLEGRRDNLVGQLGW